MTTIIYQKSTKTLGADTQITKDEAIYRGKKVAKLDKDTYALLAGCVKNLEAAQGWFKAKFDPEVIPDWTQGGEFALIMIDKKGERVRHLDSSGYIWELSDDLITFGSGGDIAYGAILAGADVETALGIAATKDIYTSAPFDIIRIE